MTRVNVLRKIIGYLVLYFIVDFNLVIIIKWKKKTRFNNLEILEMDLVSINCCVIKWTSFAMLVFYLAMMMYFAFYIIINEQTFMFSFGVQVTWTSRHKVEEEE